MGNIDFLMIFAIENSNKFQKTRFWKEKSVEDVVTIECLPFNSSRRNCEGKTRNIARVEALKKNESQLKFVEVNSC
jgi:hypothetical protein